MLARDSSRLLPAQTRRRRLPVVYRLCIGQPSRRCARGGATVDVYRASPEDDGVPGISWTARRQPSARRARMPPLNAVYALLLRRPRREV